MDAELAKLKPTKLHRIMDVVEGAGLDVTEWKKSDAGADNPKFCYEWAFTDSVNRANLLCLWFDDCETEDGAVIQRGNVRPLIRKLERDSNTQARRARRFDEALQAIRYTGGQLRVALVDETEKQKAQKIEGDKSRVAYRELDDQPWRLISYDMITGDYLLRRGEERGDTSFDTDESVTSITADQPLDADSPVPEELASSSDAEMIAQVIGLLQRKDIAETTRRALIDARVGQGAFRSMLDRIWRGRCAVTGCGEPAILRASHIQPWRLSNDQQRLDPENGLLLSANLDALFDRGLVTFEDGGRMLLSPQLKAGTALELGLPIPLRVPLSAGQKSYLRIHREKSFRK